VNKAGVTVEKAGLRRRKQGLQWRKQVYGEESRGYSGESIVCCIESNFTRIKMKNALFTVKKPGYKLNEK